MKSLDFLIENGKILDETFYYRGLINLIQGNMEKGEQDLANSFKKNKTNDSVSRQLCLIYLSDLSLSKL